MAFVVLRIQMTCFFQKIRQILQLMTVPLTVSHLINTFQFLQEVQLLRLSHQKMVDTRWLLHSLMTTGMLHIRQKTHIALVKALRLKVRLLFKTMFVLQRHRKPRSKAKKPLSKKTLLYLVEQFQPTLTVLLSVLKSQICLVDLLETFKLLHHLQIKISLNTHQTLLLQIQMEMLLMSKRQFTPLAQKQNQVDASSLVVQQMHILQQKFLKIQERSLLNHARLVQSVKQSWMQFVSVTMLFLILQVCSLIQMQKTYRLVTLLSTMLIKFMKKLLRFINIQLKKVSCYSAFVTHETETFTSVNLTKALTSQTHVVLALKTRQQRKQTREQPRQKMLKRAREKAVVMEREVLATVTA